MERIDFRRYEGFESIDSSVLVSVRGGISGTWIRKVLRLIGKLIDEYGKDFKEGFKEGWNEGK